MGTGKKHCRVRKFFGQSDRDRGAEGSTVEPSAQGGGEAGHQPG